MSVLVSIIIPAFNTEFVVGEAIASCLCQELTGEGTDIEILLVDDGSSDGTLRVANELAALDSRVRVIPLPQNVGTFAARIAGVLESRGEFILFLNSDDVIPKDCVAAYLRALRGDSDVDIVFADRITHSKDSQKITYNFAHLAAPCVLRGTQIFDEVFESKRLQSSRWTQTGKLYTRKILCQAIDFIRQTFGEIPRGISNFDDALFSFAILQFAQTALVCDFVAYEYLYRNRDEKIRTLLYPNNDMRYGARMVAYLEALASSQQVRDSALCSSSAAFVRYCKYFYYDRMRHGAVFVALDSSSKPSIFPIYLRAVASSMRYGRRGRAIVRMLLFMISLGRIRR